MKRNFIKFMRSSPKYLLLFGAIFKASIISPRPFNELLVHLIAYYHLNSDYQYLALHTHLQVRDA